MCIRVVSLFSISRMTLSEPPQRANQLDYQSVYVFVCVCVCVCVLWRSPDGLSYLCVYVCVFVGSLDGWS
jgi:hypothetical protein